MKLICYLALTYTQSRTHTKKGLLRSGKNFGILAVMFDVCALMTAFMIAVAFSTLYVVVAYVGSHAS